jgi:2-polyprenyl-3-methyl-5-hydroxy-6-metoxy-1,4-benzoquinol methylase
MDRMVAGNWTSSGAAAEATSTADPELTSCPACGGALGAAVLQSSDRLCGLPGTFSVARCGLCGMGVTLPRVDEARLASFYPTTYGTYERLPTGVLSRVSAAVQRFQAWQGLRTTPMECLAELPAGRLLDVGCGRGDLGAWFVRRGWSVVGVEPSSQACAVARSRGIDARTGTLADVELEPGTFDVVAFRHSLEHVSDPLYNLRRAREALREGGVMVVSLPNFGCWQSRRFGGSWFHLDVPRHRFHFNPEALRTMLIRAGFTQVQITTSSSSIGLPATIQYELAGRCLFPDGLKLRVVAALCATTTPLIWLINRLTGGGDVLHAVARSR